MESTGHNEWEMYPSHTKGYKPTHSSHSHIHHNDTTVVMDESVSGRNGWTLMTQTPSTVALNEWYSLVYRATSFTSFSNQLSILKTELQMLIWLNQFHSPLFTQTIRPCSAVCESCKGPYQSCPHSHSVHLTANPYPWTISPIKYNTLRRRGSMKRYPSKPIPFSPSMAPQ